MIKITHEFKDAKAAMEHLKKMGGKVKAEPEDDGNVDDLLDDDGDGSEGEESEGEEVDIDMIRDKITELGQSGKKAKLQALFKKYKLKGISGLKEEKYAAFYAELSKIK